MGEKFKEVMFYDLSPEGKRRNDEMFDKIPDANITENGTMFFEDCQPEGKMIPDKYSGKEGKAVSILRTLADKGLIKNEGIDETLRLIEVITEVL